jgi:hypothetical protein
MVMLCNQRLNHEKPSVKRDLTKVPVRQLQRELKLWKKNSYEWTCLQFELLLRDLARENKRYKECNHP